MLGAETHVQDWPPPRTASISDVIANARSSAPSESTVRDRGVIVSWKCRLNIHAASRQSGMLMTNTPRQIPSCEKTPPSIGPTTEEMAHTLAR
jgi:hypothetical protein